MAIHDLLWACPHCRQYHSLAGTDESAECSVCQSRLFRGQGARIRLVDPDGNAELRTPAEWETRLPPIDTLPTNGQLGPEAATCRIGLAARPVRHGTRFLGWAEHFAPAYDATVRLDTNRIEIRAVGEGPRFDWPLESITAVQPSSSSLQLNTPEYLVSIRFRQGSVRRWEAVLCRLLRARLRNLGRGDVVEFQPRIRLRNR